MQINIPGATQSLYIAGSLSYLIHFDFFFIDITVTIATTKKSWKSRKKCLSRNKGENIIGVGSKMAKGCQMIINGRQYSDFWYCEVFV